MGMFYKPSDSWVGDLVPYCENGTFYAFYLHDPRSYKDKYAENTTWHLATTTDFVNVDYKGTAIKRGTTNDFNYNIYTGSVIKDKDGQYHAFYTAFNENKPYKDGKSVQLVMRAVGDDLENVETDEDFLFPSDGVIYEDFDWRDPFVFWVEEEQCYYMLLAARKRGSGELRGGCISLSKSKDLKNWTYHEPFYDPKMYITMECPEVFKMGKYWYLIFSEFSDKFTTRYRYSESLTGPWIIPNDDVFDTRTNYAIKTASDGDKRYAFGWIASKKNENDFGDWDWGGTMVFHEIKQNSNTGELKIVPIDSVANYYKNYFELSAPSFYNNKLRDGFGVESETLGAVLYDCPTENFSASISFDIKGGKEFGIALHVDGGMEKGYFLRMMPENNIVAWDLWPRTEKGYYQWQIAGDVPYQIETVRNLPKADHYDVLIVREGSICLVYINNEIALSMRIYDHKGGKLGMYVVQGEVEIKELKIKL